jgi:hypothetical protein
MKVNDVSIKLSDEWYETKELELKPNQMAGAPKRVILILREKFNGPDSSEEKLLTVSVSIAELFNAVEVIKQSYFDS